MAAFAFIDRDRRFDANDVVGNVNFGDAGRDIVQNFFASARPAEPKLPWYKLSPDQDLFTWLRWPGRLTELVGRERETALLRDWARGPGAIRARFVSGPGGVGKSRLAAEVAQSLRAAGWTAGFVRLDQPAIVPVRRLGAFLILDYPEEGRQAVRALLRDLAELEAPPEHRVRLLLVSRHGPELWQSEIDAAGAGARFDALALNLQPLHDPEQAYRVFCSARQRVPVPAPPTAAAVDPAAFGAWLAQEPAHHLPLFIAAAALHSVLYPDRSIVAITGAAVIPALVRRERRRLAEESERNGLNRDLLARLAAFATIRGPLGEAEFRRLADSELEIGLPPAPVIDALRPTGRIDKDGRFPPPGPDLIATALVAMVFGKRPERAPDWLWAAIGDRPEVTLERLGRLTYDAELVLHDPRLGRWLAAMVEGKPDRCQALSAFVSQTMPWELAALVAEVWRVLSRQPGDEAERARALNNLSIASADLGEAAEALDAIQQAMEIYPRLAAAQPARYALDLAASLNNLSADLNAAGEKEAAWQALREAIQLIEPYAAASPQAPPGQLLAIMRQNLARLEQEPQTGA